MRKKLALALFFASTAAFAYPNEPEGFRGITWGDDLESNKAEMVLVEQSADEHFYTRTNDKMQIGGAELKSIYYSYANGKFVQAMILTEGYSNKVALIDAFKSQFGKGFQSNRYIDKYVWNGPISVIYLECKIVGDKCSVSFMSKKKLEEARAADKAKARSAGEDM